jgi:hypothetical protein
MLAAQKGIRGLGVVHDQFGRTGVALAMHTNELTPKRRTREAEEHLIPIRTAGPVVRMGGIRSPHVRYRVDPVRRGL